MINFWVPIAVLIVSFLLGVPIVLSIMSCGVVYLAMTGLDLSIIAEQICPNMFNSYTLLAVPMFILMASVMNTGNVTNLLFGFCKALIGKQRGALAQVNIIVSLIFSGMSGSAVADASGIGLIEVEAMKEDGYDPAFSAALTSATSTVGPIIPPSIPMVIYSMLSGASVGALFLGGVIPGVLLCAFLSFYVAYISKKRNYPRGKKYTFREFLGYFKRAFPAVLTPVILFAGIYGGVMTPTEAGAVAALYAMIIAVFLYRSISFRQLVEAVKNTALATGVITLLTASSFVMSFMVAREGISGIIANWVLNITQNKYLLLLVINLVFLMLGMVLDISVIQYVFIPLVLPIVVALGINLVHFGVVIVLNMMIGLSTPPFGMCLFVSSSLAKAKLDRVSKQIIPMILVMILMLFILCYVPVLVTWLPGLLGF